MKNLIAIKSNQTTNPSIEVKDFSLESVSKGIASILKVKQEDVFQLIANVNGGIYGVKKHSGTYNMLPESPIKDERTTKTFEVEYLELLETISQVIEFFESPTKEDTN